VEARHRRIVALQLCGAFDVQRLEEDLRAVDELEWKRQPGPYHGGEWTGVSLWAARGNAERVTGPRPGLFPYRPTPVLDRTPYIREVLDGFRCPKQVVRLLALPPGGRIEEHVDGRTDFDCGSIRLHLPIVTHEDVVFTVGGVRQRWSPGELWWADFALPHSVFNESPIRRVHLVIDLEINEYTLSLFPRDFIETKRAEGRIGLALEPLALNVDALERYRCSFKIPGEPLDSANDFDGEIGLGDSKRLFLLLDGRPVWRLQPVAGNLLAVVGAARNISFECRFEGGQLTGLTLVWLGAFRDLVTDRWPQRRWELKLDRP
jgi:hypothetical protein